VTLDEAIKRLAEPKRRGRRAAAAALREVGEEPGTGKKVEVRDGRYGPYVTDGEYNASLKAGDTVEAITLDRAIELLQARRERGPAKKSQAKK